jgi:hypothetical protein
MTNTQHRLAAISLLLPGLVALFGCTGRDEARLESWSGGAWQETAFTGYEIAGKRDGASTSAVAVFTLDANARLQVNLTIVYNPTPALGSGDWTLSGPEEDAGEARAESIKFLGGQGEGPSLGGRFRLEENGAPRFRVTLPSRPLE